MIGVVLTIDGSAPCPVCGGRDLRLVPRTDDRIWVRAECGCGVSGPWQHCSEGRAHDAAARSWARLGAAKLGRTVPLRGTIGAGSRRRK